MASLQEIQALVDQAQAKIKEGDLERVKTGIWPYIKTKIGECTDLDLSGRRDLGKLIYKRLNDQTLQAMPTQINVGQLKADLEAGGVQAPEPAQVYRWLPW